MELRQFLSESVVGDGFAWGNFIALIGFIAVIGTWLWMASPMVKNLLGFVTGKPTGGQVVNITPTQGESLLSSVVRMEDPLSAVKTDRTEMTATTASVTQESKEEKNNNTITPTASYTPTTTHTPYQKKVSNITPSPNFKPTATRVVKTPEPKIVYVEVTKIVEEVIIQEEKVYIYVEVTPTPAETPIQEETEEPYPGPIDTPVYGDPLDCENEVCVFVFIPLVNR